MKLFLKLFLIGFFLSFSGYAQSSLQLTTSATSGCVDGTLTIDVTSGAPPYYFEVYHRDYHYSSGAVSNNHLELTGLAHGDYYVYVSDQGGNYYGTGTEVNLPSLFDISYVNTPVTCNNNGTITAEATGGTAPYSYLWSTGEQTQQIENLSSGIYFLTVTDANGCIASSDSLYIQQKTFQLYTESTPYTCHQSGSATVSAYGESASTYSYYWKTNPVQTTATATGLQPGTYDVIVTDAHGCTNSTTVSVWEQNSFGVGITTQDADCEQMNGSVQVVPTGGTAPYNYSWDNGDNASHLENLPGNTYYTVTVTDAEACKSIGYAYINKKSPVQVTFSTIPALCHAQGGSATAIPGNGTAPYSYIWYNSSATTATLNDLSAGYYFLQVKDANGCICYGSTTIEEQSNCKSTISGTVYYDMNSNCIQDNGEVGVPYAAIKYGDYLCAYANNNGYYEINVYPGTYTLRPNYYPNWATSCADVVINVPNGGNSYANNNLFISPSTVISDASIYMFSTPQRPGFTRPVYLSLNNNGTAIEDATITYTFSEDWNFSHADPLPDAYDASSRTATWHVNSFAPWSYESITINMNVPSSTAIGVTLTAEATIQLTNTDANEDNNTTSLTTVTTNSFDPNDIQVSPMGTGSEGFITEQLDALTYRIRFQNTGTDVAYNVSVKSKIDANLEDYTISILDVSHEVKASIQNDSLKFEFVNINLSDSTSNEAGSHGYIVYRINKKSDLAPLTQIFNKVDIYFDYNAPVETNEVKNTIASVTPNVSELNVQDDLLFYPNPCRDHAQLSINMKEASDLSVQLYSASGQQMSVIDNISVIQGLQVIELNLAPFNLPAGLYVAKVVVKDKVYTKSILINK